jgi:8-oxo-dGTP pyrophosphatase MutT (NUDIX family)
MNPAPIRVEKVDGIEAIVEPYTWCFAQDHADRIAAHWQKLIAARPRLFDGRVLLMHRGEIVERDGLRILRCGHFETSFSAFVAWRDFGFPDLSVRNIFAMAALRTTDDAFILGEMEAHTSNAGMIYFPAGTPDAHDVHDGVLDLAASARRELVEETGLNARDITFEPGWTLVHDSGRLACMKEARIAGDASSLVAAIESRLARDADAELARMHIVRGAADVPADRVPAFLLAYFNWIFTAG